MAVQPIPLRSMVLPQPGRILGQSGVALGRAELLHGLEQLRRREREREAHLLDVVQCALELVFPAHVQPGVEDEPVSGESGSTDMRDLLRVF